MEGKIKYPTCFARKEVSYLFLHKSTTFRLTYFPVVACRLGALNGPRFGTYRRSRHLRCEQYECAQCIDLARFRQRGRVENGLIRERERERMYRGVRNRLRTSDWSNRIFNIHWRHTRFTAHIIHILVVT